MNCRRPWQLRDEAGPCLWQGSLPGTPSVSPHRFPVRVSFPAAPVLSPAGAMREIGLGLAVGAGVGALWKMYHANDRFLTAQANKRWIDRKVELRSRAAAAADA